MKNQYFSIKKKTLSIKKKSIYHFSFLAGIILNISIFVVVLGSFPEIIRELTIFFNITVNT